MSNFLTAVGLVRGGISFFRDAKYLLSEGRNVKEIYQKLTTVNIQSKSELISSFLASEIDYKDHIKIQGILIDYAHLYKPSSYVNSLEDSEIEMGKFPNGASGIRGVTIQNLQTSEIILSTGWKPFQLPIGKIPSIQTEEGEFTLSFLYPLDFKSFTYTGINGFVGGPLDVPTFDMPDNSKPIPVILRKEDSVKYQFQKVEITARLTILPDSVIGKLISNSFSAMAFSEIVNPLNIKMPSLCLNVTSNKSQIMLLKKEPRINECRASIFMETHIEGEATDKLIERIPEIASIAFTGNKNNASFISKDFKDKNPTLFQISKENNIKLIGKFPNILGFYFESNLINLEDDYKSFVKSFDSFSDKVHEMAPRLSLHIDFMHDFNLKNYFQNPVLKSKSTSFIREDDMNETVNWLKS